MPTCGTRPKTAYEPENGDAENGSGIREPGQVCLGETAGQNEPDKAGVQKAVHTQAPRILNSDRTEVTQRSSKAGCQTAQGWEGGKKRNTAR